MNHKKGILICILTVLLYSGWAQTELVVKFEKCDRVTRTRDFKFSILTQSDTINVFSTLLDMEIKENHLFVSLDNHSTSGLFEYRSENRKWKSIECTFSTDATQLKRIEIGLYFSVKYPKAEFLQEFNVDKFYRTSSVSMESRKLEVDSQPFFMLISHSDTAFWGVSPTNHFFGTMKVKTDVGWDEFSGSYCTSAVLAKPLTKSDTAGSWVPNYLPGNEYTIKGPGAYKYVVLMALDEHGAEVPISHLKRGRTKYTSRAFYELETEFDIE